MNGLEWIFFNLGGPPIIYYLEDVRRTCNVKERSFHKFFDYRLDIEWLLEEHYRHDKYYKEAEFSKN